MLAELHALRNAQFTAEHQEITRFEQRVMQGCQSLCDLVHSLAGEHSTVRNGLVELITTVKG
jgi:hypothetical protein